VRSFRDRLRYVRTERCGAPAGVKPQYRVQYVRDVLMGEGWQRQGRGVNHAWNPSHAQGTFRAASHGSPPPDLPDAYEERSRLTTQGVEALKRQAAEAALARVESDMVLGLGTGSTVAHLLDLLGEAVASGALTGIVAVPTSVRTEMRARELGIQLIGLIDRPSLDLTIDGADEVSPELDLIKGGGGALLREKMVAQASDRLVIIADEKKAVARLGLTYPLPVEVVRWGWESHVRFLEGWGAQVALRVGRDGEPIVSDNGQWLLDCSFEGGIEDPVALEAALARRAGVVETGLFLGLADEAFIAAEGGVRRIGR
jgi:ribose 5-phosphate isomerase A